MSLIAGYKASKAIATLLAEQPASNSEFRQAISNLRKIGAPAIPRLIDALHSTQETSVIENLLANLLTDITYPLYVDALSNQQRKTVTGITRVFLKSDNYDPNRLTDLFHNQEISKSALADIFLAHKAKINASQLLKLIDTVPSNARPIIYKVLDKVVTDDDVQLIINKLVSKEPLVRTYLTTLLPRFNSVQAKSALIRLLDDPNKNVRQAALRGLSEMHADDTVEVICHLLSDPDLTVQTVAIETLISLNAPNTVKYLIEVLQDESEYVRRAAVEVLNEIGDQNAIKDLLNALRDADWWVKVRSADALGNIGGPKVFEAILALIKDEDEFLRRTAVEILNTSRDAKALDRLVEALNDEDWWVRERAADALAAIGDKRAVGPLIDMLDKVSDGQQVVIRALSALGDNRAIDPLIKLLDNKDANVRKEVLHALKELTDRDHASLVHDAITQCAVSSDSEENKIVIEAVDTLCTRFGIAPKAGAVSRLDIEVPSEEFHKLSAPSSSMINLSSDVIDATMLKPGDEFLDRYRVIRQVGRGAFGVVILVEDLVVKDQFILKFLNPYVASDENTIRRFTHELRYARKITHNNVIRIYDFIIQRKTYAISMEYFPSRSLTGIFCKEHKVSMRRALQIMRDVCSGMRAAQVVNVVHRDLKPGNILVNDDYLVKIVDFGLAAAASSNDSRLTKTGILLGTPTYMAPEQVRGKQIDSRTDIYSIGVIMYEVFTGKAPYVGEESMAIMFQHVEGNATPPRELNPGIPESLENIIIKAMSVDPDKRFQSFDEILFELESLLNQEFA